MKGVKGVKGVSEGSEGSYNDVDDSAMDSVFADWRTLGMEPVCKQRLRRLRWLPEQLEGRRFHPMCDDRLLRQIYHFIYMTTSIQKV